MTRILTLAAFAATLLAAFGSAAAETDQAYLQRKLSFRYVDQPNDLTKGSDILDNSAIATGTETGTFWGNNHIPGLQTIVRSLIKPAGSGGDGNLQYVASQIVHVLDKPVIIMLLNDTSNLTAEAFNHWDACDNDHGKAWPCAMNFATDDDRRKDCADKLGTTAPARRDGLWAGQMSLGEAVFTGDPGWATSTFIHELVHTQDRSDRRPHMFWVSGRAYHYGADGSHFGVEAVPNLAATYQEGIANTLRLLVNEKRRKEMFDWFANDDVVYVEKALVPPGTGPGALPCALSVAYPSEDVWLYQQLKKAGAHEITPSAGSPAGSGYAYFRIRDIPPRFIVHDEYIIALTFSEYARHMGLPKFMAALKTNDATIYRVSTSPIAQLYNTLCTAGLEGRSLSSVTGVNEAGPKPYLIPLAYADYFTGYQSKTKADYASIFEGMLRSEWIDLYWDGYKDGVRAAVPIDAAHKPKFDDLTSIAITLGVNQSTAAH